MATTTTATTEEGAVVEDTPASPSIEEHQAAAAEKEEKRKKKEQWDEEVHELAMNLFFMCNSKTSFRKHQQAQNSADSIYRHGGPRMRVYKCPNCNSYHLTSKRLGK